MNGGSEHVFHRYAAEPQFAAVARASLLDCLKKLSLPEERLFAILYATGEALANAIEHGSGDYFCFDIDWREQHLEIEVESPGNWQITEPDEEHGRGIPIMQALADGLDIATGANGTVVHLSFALDSAQNETA